jgi:hypothetical protein
VLGKNWARRPAAGTIDVPIKGDFNMKGGNLVTQPGPIKVLSRRFAWLAFAPTLAFAQGEQPGVRDLMQARNYAMGGAYRALGLGTESIDGNPAAMGLRKRYEIDLGGALDTETKFKFGSAAIYDTQTSELGAGVSYHLISVGRDDRHRTAHQATLALSYPLSQGIILGASGHYVLENGAFHRSGITMDAGLALKLSDSLSASISAHNIIDVKNPDLTRYYAFGLGYVKGQVIAAADLRADFTSGNTQYFPGVGFEYITGGNFPLRAGYSYDSRASSHFASGGLGLLGDSGGLDLAYRQEFGGAQSKLIALTIKLNL